MELGFTVFALEASYAACQPIDRYVMHGIGDPAAVLSGQHYLAWDTEESAALIGWMRRYNEGVGEDRKVSFHGLDAGFNEVGRESVRGYLERLAPEWLHIIAETFTALDAQERKWPLATDGDVIASAVEPLMNARERTVTRGDSTARPGVGSEVVAVAKGRAHGSRPQGRGFDLDSGLPTSWSRWKRRLGMC